MSHESNLPPGVTESMIPGNSKRDIAIQRAWEKIEEELGDLPGWLSDAILGDRTTDLGTVASRLDWLYECDWDARDAPANPTAEDLWRGRSYRDAIEEARNIAAEASEW